MSEILRPDQIEARTRASKDFERAWRAYSYPQRHTLEEVEWARDYILNQHDNYEVAIKSPTYPAEAEILDMVYAGLHHHGITPPPETKYKASQN